MGEEGSLSDSNSVKMPKNNLPVDLNIALDLSNRLQDIFIRIELFTVPIFRAVFALFGVKLYVLRRGKDSFANNDKFSRELAYLLNNAVEIKISVGEMAHQLMERDDLLVGLKNAKKLNGATVEIVHGPRVDPATKRVFGLAAKGIVKLFRGDKYFTNHFILVKLPSGKEYLINENSHHEPIWYQSEDEEWKAKWESRLLFYYIHESPSARIGWMRAEYERRKSTSKQIFHHPGVFPLQQMTLSTFIFRSVLNILVKHVTQPLAHIFKLPLDFNLVMIGVIVANYLNVSKLSNRKNREPWMGKYEISRSKIEAEMLPPKSFRLHQRNQHAEDYLIDYNLISRDLEKMPPKRLRDIVSQKLEAEAPTNLED